MRYPFVFILLLIIVACNKQPVKPASPAGNSGSELASLKGMPPFDLATKKGIDQYVHWVDSLNSAGKTRILTDTITGEMGTRKELWIYNDHNICLKLSTNTKLPQILERWFYLYPSQERVVFLEEFHFDGILYREDIFYYPNGTSYLKGYSRNSFNPDNLSYKAFEDYPGKYFGIQYHDDPNKINIMIRIYLDRL